MRVKRSGWLLRAAIAGSVLGVQGIAVQAQDEGQSAAERGLEEMIVTAQRREESAQSVPIAISAFDGNRMREQNIGSAQDLVGKVPSVTVTSGGGPRNSEVVVIRGQGQTYLAPVGVVNYFAEVPLIQGGIIPNQGGPGTFFDLESMQVLRGPQGTLFGRNTTGGAVLLGPKKPSDEFEGYVQAQAGNYNDAEYEGAVSIPLIEDVLMVRLSYKDVERDGFTRDVGPQPYGYTDVCQPMPDLLCGAFSPAGTRSAGYAGRDYDNKDYWHARLGVLWRPTDTIENHFVALSSESKDNGTGFIFDGAGPGYNLANLTGNMAYEPMEVVIGNATGNFDRMFNPAVTQGILAAQGRLGERRTAMNVDQYTNVEADAFIDTLSIELGENLTFRNIASYQTMKVAFNWDLNGSILPMLSQQNPVNDDPRNPFAAVGEKGNISDSSQVTEEAQLQGTLFDEQLDFVTGVYYSKMEPEGYQATGSFNAATWSPGGGYELEVTSTAFYAQGTLHLGLLSDALEQFRFTAGVRRTQDKTEGARFMPSYFSDRVYYGPGANDYDVPARTEELNSDEPTWTLGLDYEMSDSVLLYGKVTRGYKAGSFNYAAPRQLTYEPEFVTNYELGAKTEFMLGEMPARVNLNLFHLDYEDMQRAAADNYGIGSFQPEEYDRNGDGDTRDLVCVGPNGENYSASTSCLDQGAITFNADSAHIDGLEIEVAIEPIENLNISASYSYMDAQYDDFELTQYPDPLRGGTTITDCNGPVTVPGVGQAPVVLDLGCIPFQNAPDKIASLNARYTLPLGDGIGDLTLIGSVNYRGDQYSSATTTPQDDPGAWIDAYHVYNLSAEWNGIMGSSFDARAFVDNVTDETYKTYSYVGLQQSSGFVNSIYGEPRMYGFSLRYRFGAQGD